MPARPHARGVLGASLVAWLGCQMPPGVELADGRSEAKLEPQVVEAVPGHAEMAPPEVPGEDGLLAEARRSIAGGRVSADVRRRLAESNQPHHRRATRLLQAIALEEPLPIVAPPRPEPEPTPNPEPEPTPNPEPAPDPDDDHRIEDHRIDELDPRRYSPDSAVAAWFAGMVTIEIPTEPVHDPLAGLLALDEPGVLLPVDLESAFPRVILTRLDLARLDGGALRLGIVGAGTVGLRVQPLSAHRLRVRLDHAGAVPSFLAARPSEPELEVTQVRRGRGCVEVDLELAPGWTLVLGRGLGNGAELEFAATMQGAR